MEERANRNPFRIIENAMQGFVDEAFLTQPFFHTLRTGQWTAEFMKYFAWQYAHYSAHFPRVLGAAISAMAPADEWWIPLADNLWDEAGRGHSGRSHAVLYQTFLQSVDPLAANRYAIRSQWPKMGESVRDAVEGFVQFFYQATPIEAMAAVGLGSEFFAGQIMGAIGEGLKHPQYQRQSGIATNFWDLHAGVDEPRHYALCRRVLIENAPDNMHPRLLRIGQTIAGSEAAMYRGIFEEGRSLLGR